MLLFLFFTISHDHHVLINFTYNSRYLAGNQIEMHNLIQQDTKAQVLLT